MTSPTPPTPTFFRTFLQFFLFGLIGASGIIVDFAVVSFCREFFQLDVRVGIFPAFLFAVTWNFELNRRITFREEGQQLSWMRAYLYFVLICLAGLAVRWVATHLCIETLGLRGDRFFAISFEMIDKAQGGQKIPLLQLPQIRLSYIAYIVGIGVASLFNFFGSKWFAFAPGEPEAAQK